MGVEIPTHLRIVEKPQKGGRIILYRLPQYVVAMHVAETVGFGGSCDILGFWGDQHDDRNRSKITDGKVKVELVLPSTLNGSMDYDYFSSLAESMIEELENPTKNPKVPQSLRVAYAQAKEFVRSKR